MNDELNLKKVSSNALEDYLYCGLLFKYKHVLELPYMPGSIKEAFYYAYKTALLKFFHEVGLANKPLRKCIAEAQELFVKKMRFALAAFGKLDLSGEDLVAKGVLQLNQAHSLFAPQRDVLAAIDLPVTVNYLGVDISYNLDALIVENDSSSARKFRALAIADDFSDMALSAKHDNLQFGLMKKTLMDHFSTGKKGQGAFSEAKVEVIKVSGAKSATSSTHYAPKPESHLNPVVDTAIKGIEHNIILPTAQAQKCRNCWFNDICSTKHCSTDPVNHAHLKQKMTAKVTKVAKNASIDK